MLLHKLLDSNSDWTYNALYHGWINPVMSSIEFHDQGTTNAHVEMIWDGRYRLRFLPVTYDRQPMNLSWTIDPPNTIVNRPLTKIVLEAKTALTLDLYLYSTCQVTATPTVPGRMLPGRWDIQESHAGLFDALHPRTSGLDSLGLVSKMR